MALACFALFFVVGVPLSASPETRESYLARLRHVCEIECLQPRQLLRAARKRGRGAKDEVAGIIDVVFISRFGDRYRLHSLHGSYSVSSALINGSPSVNGKPTANAPGDIVIEMDANTMLRLVQSASLGASPADPPSADHDLPEADSSEPEDGILVERFRKPKITLPSMLELRSLVINRRVAVRGTPVLTPSLVGARLDHRRSQLTILIDNIDDLVLLPRYDADGNAILDGPLAGLGAP